MSKNGLAYLGIFVFLIGVSISYTSSPETKPSRPYPVNQWRAPTRTAESAAVQRTPEPPAAPAAPVFIPPTFRGYRCEGDCSGHQAGYNWAEENGIDDPEDCHSAQTGRWTDDNINNSPSFTEGCLEYLRDEGITNSDDEISARDDDSDNDEDSEHEDE